MEANADAMLIQNNCGSRRLKYLRVLKGLLKRGQSGMNKQKSRCLRRDDVPHAPPTFLQIRLDREYLD
jgi:hypothetical protein